VRVNFLRSNGELIAEEIPSPELHRHRVSEWRSADFLGVISDKPVGWMYAAGMYNHPWSLPRFIIFYDHRPSSSDWIITQFWSSVNRNTQAGLRVKQMARWLFTCNYNTSHLFLFMYKTQQTERATSHWSANRLTLTHCPNHPPPQDPHPISRARTPLSCSRLPKEVRQWTRQLGHSIHCRFQSPTPPPELWTTKISASNYNR
jgi:hypothetical protein